MARKSPSLWLSVNPGVLRHQVQVQARTTTPDDFGQPQDIWATVASVPAGIDVPGGSTPVAAIGRAIVREAYPPGQITAQITHLVLVRWSKTLLQPGMRVVFSDNSVTPANVHYLRIQGVTNLEQRNMWLLLHTLELNATE